MTARRGLENAGVSHRGREEGQPQSHHEHKHSEGGSGVAKGGGRGEEGGGAEREGGSRQKGSNGSLRTNETYEGKMRKGASISSQPTATTG